MATCKQCGCTISWDCECNPEYNELLEEAQKQESDDADDNGQAEEDKDHKNPRL